MPHKPKPAREDHTVHLTIPIPGWLKNQLITTAQNTQESLQAFVVRTLTNATRTHNNQPPLQNNTPPNPLQPVLDYLTGEKTLQPCGQTTCNKIPTKLNQNTYCNTCGIRLT
jgi:hypothetical protein